MGLEVNDSVPRGGGGSVKGLCSAHLSWQVSRRMAELQASVPRHVRSSVEEGWAGRISEPCEQPAQLPKARGSVGPAADGVSVPWCQGVPGRSPSPKTCHCGRKQVFFWGGGSAQSLYYIWISS